MPLTLNQTQFSNLYIDYEYTIANEALLVEYVGNLILGQYRHIQRVIKNLSTREINDNVVIDSALTILNSPEKVKVHGLLFQMISWVELCVRHKDEKFYQYHPHTQLAMQGFDGIAVKLTNDNKLEKIIITEDKCTTHPRQKLHAEVFPEFEDLESHKKDNAIVCNVMSLLEGFSDDVQFQIEADISNLNYRQYRAGLTRDEKHNDKDGREKLFVDYDTHVTGALSKRSASTIYIPDLRVWMEKFKSEVIDFLNSKKKP